MKRTFSFIILLFVVLNSCFVQKNFVQKNLERSDFHEHVEMDVLFSPDSVIFGDTLNITIILKNISKHPIVFFSDANFIMQRWAEGTFASQSVFLSDFTTNFKLKETIQPEESITKEYKVAVVSPFFYRGEVSIRFLYLAKPSNSIIDISYQDEYLIVF